MASDDFEALKHRRRARPPDGAIEWAAEVVGDRIAHVRPLTGGMSTGIHLLTTDGGERVVMRRFLNQHWLAIDPDLARREAGVLRALEPTDVPAPTFVGVDERGERCEAPTVLMGFVRGRRTTAPDLRRYAADLAHAMATIHDVAAPPVDGLPDEVAQIGRMVQEPSPNRHGSNPTPELWAKVAAGVDAVTFRTNVLIHGDFHPGNVLLARGRLSAVVDWPLAAAGQPGSDLGMCRLDVGMMLGLDVADMVLAAYEAETGDALADRGWWDLFAASRADGALDTWTESCVGLGPTDPPLETVTQRFDDFVAGALAAM